MFFSGDECNRFNITGKALICQPHAELKLKVREHAQAAHNHLCIDLTGKLNCQAAVAVTLIFGFALNASVTRPYVLQVRTSVISMACHKQPSPLHRRDARRVRQYQYDHSEWDRTSRGTML